MSATGRSEAAGTGVVRHPDDFYATPAWCTRVILPHVLSSLSSRSTPRVLDPCCGDGAILRELEEWSTPLSVGGLEVDAGRAELARRYGAVREVDALLPSADWGQPDIVLTNPPFALAMEFVQRSIEEVGERGTVCFLLRLNWLASQKRAAWMRANTPSVYVLPRRPSFTGRGTDATEYAWMVWRRDVEATVTILEVAP